MRTGLSGSEVVAVRVLSGAVDPAAHAAGLARQRAAFVGALEQGTPVPHNPDAVLPIIRRYRFDPSPTGEPAPIEVEDYPLAHAVCTRARRLVDVLPPLWLLRIGSRARNPEERS